MLENLTKEASVAVIVLNWNGFEDTVQCLNSLKNLDYRNYRVVLVDNGSDNNEGDKLKEMFPHIQLIQNKANRGYAGGNNDGINWALENNFEYVVNLNNDCIVTTGWLTNLIKGIRSTAADFASSLIMFHPATDLIYSYNDVLLPDSSTFTPQRYEEFKDDGKIAEIFSANGAGSIYSSNCLKKVMLENKQHFDELFFAYYEDVDLGSRLTSKQYKCVCVPDALIYHKYSKTSVEYSEFKIFYGERNRVICEIFNYPVYLILIAELWSLLRLIVSLIYSISNRKSKGYAYVRGLNIAKWMLLSLKAKLWIVFNLPLIFR
ncbi:glycosyltransferase family 2 protein, partial [Candidatus Omnitrophota bacterium]